MKHISNAGGPRGINTMGGLKQASEHLQSLGDYTGGNYGYQMKAGLGNLMASNVRAGIGQAKNSSRQNILGGAITASSFYGNMAKQAIADTRKGVSGRGRGNFYGDNQIALGYGIGGSSHKSGRGVQGQIGVAGNLLANQSRTPQALQSQPYAENYQFSQTLPPAYQQYNRK